MAAKTHSTVVGVFTNHSEARKATRALRDAGFTEEQIGVASSSHRGSGAPDDDDDDGGYAGEGAMAGAATGAGIGALWGLGILAGVLPAIGPAIAGGSLAMLLSSAAAGAAAAGLAGALIGMGLSGEEAEYYEGEMKAGRTIVTVEVNGRREEALRILRQFGGYDMADRRLADRGRSTLDRESETKMTGPATSRASDATKTSRPASGPGHTIQVHEERLHVDKTPVDKGEVRVRKETRTEHKTIDVPVTREEVVIERRPASGDAASASDLGDDQEVRIPVREEQLNVEKRAVVAEEVRVGKRRVQDTRHVDETLRKEEIKVETEGNVDVRDER